MIPSVPLRRRCAPALLVLAAPLALAACGGEPVNTAGTPATPPVTPNACTLLPDSAVRDALTLPPPASPSASPQTPSPEPTPSGVYAVRSIAINGRVNVANAGTCTYTSPNGDELIVAVLPKTTLAAVRNAQPDGSGLGTAFLVNTSNASALDVQAGGAVVELTLDLGDTDAPTRANRLARLGGLVAHTALPTLNPQASPSAGGSTSASAAPVASVGTVVTGQNAAQKVSELQTLTFDPASVSLKSGAVVQWTNTGSVPHNVTFDDYPDLTSGTMNGGDVYEIKFTQPGTYMYHCTFHANMDGQITVG